MRLIVGCVDYTHFDSNVRNFSLLSLNSLAHNKRKSKGIPFNLFVLHFFAFQLPVQLLCFCFVTIDSSISDKKQFCGTHFPLKPTFKFF